MGQPDGKGISRRTGDKRWALRTQGRTQAQLLAGLGSDAQRDIPHPSGTAGVWLNLSGSTTGYGSAVVTATPAKALKLPLHPFDLASPITMVRLRIWSSDISVSTPLVDRTMPVETENLVAKDHYVDFGLELPAGSYFVAWNCDGKTGYFRREDFTVPVSPTYGYWTFLNDIQSPNSANLQRPGGQVSAYLETFAESPLLATSNLGVPNGTMLQGTTTGTFSGWSCAFPARTNFNRVIIQAGRFNPASSATSVRILLRMGGQSGDIVGDLTLTGLEFTYGKPIPLVFDFEEPISTADFVEVVADGSLGFRKVNDGAYPVASGYAQTRYTTSANTSAYTWANSVTQYCLAMEFLNWDHSFLGFAGPGDFKAKLQVAANPAPKILLPNTLYAVEGQEFSIYADNVIWTPSGLQAENIYTFDFVHSGSLGNQLGGNGHSARYSLIPLAADAGTSMLTLYVYQNGFLVASKTISLVIKALTAGNGVTRKYLAIGDSKTVGGYWLAEVKRLFTGDVMTLSQLGGITGSVNDSYGNAQTFACQAHSGRSANWFYTDNTAVTGSPFVLAGAGVFSFPAYLTAMSYTMGTGDWVSFYLGDNDVFAATTDAACNTLLGIMRTALDAMIANIHAHAPGIRVGINLPPPPSRDQDAFGDDYFAGQTQWRFRRNMNMLHEFLIAYYDTAAMRTANTFLLGYGHVLDTREDMEASNTTYLEVTGATNASPIVITTAKGHNMRTGDSVTIVNATGNTAANGAWTVTVTGAGTFILNTSVGNGTYVNGGLASVPLWKSQVNRVQQTMQTNALHPAPVGYYHLGGSAAFPNIKGFES